MDDFRYSCMHEWQHSVRFSFPRFPLEFHPVFQVIDSVTERQSTYTGQYTLRALAGGTRLNNMSPFDESRNVYVCDNNVTFSGDTALDDEEIRSSGSIQGIFTSLTD